MRFCQLLVLQILNMLQLADQMLLAEEELHNLLQRHIGLPLCLGRLPGRLLSLLLALLLLLLLLRWLLLLLLLLLRLLRLPLLLPRRELLLLLLLLLPPPRAALLPWLLSASWDLHLQQRTARPAS